MTIAEAIERRRLRWQADPSIAEDNRWIDRFARELLTNPLWRKEVKKRPFSLIEGVMQVVDKEGRVVPFFLNPAQRRVLDAIEREGTRRPYFILKGRQQGMTTLLTAMQLCLCLTRRNFAGLTMADNASNAEAIFLDKAKGLFGRLPKALVPHVKYNSRKELVFDRLGSTWRVATALDDTGRSRTLHFVHYSEVAFFKCDLKRLMRAMGQTVREGLVVYETTANGFNQAKDLWDSGLCVNLFVPWWESSEYASTHVAPVIDGWLAKRMKYLEGKGLTPEQRNWYVAKYLELDRDGLRQEYPCFPEDAFVSSGECMFDKDAVVEALGRAKEGKRGHYRYTLTHTEEGERIEEMVWEDDPSGFIEIHEPPSAPRDGIVEQYVIGGDTSGEGSDYYTAKVVSVLTRRTVATLRVKLIDDDLYAAQLYCLGRAYHDAWIAVEVNFCLTPSRLLAKWGYDNLYRRMAEDGDTGAHNLRLGFRTTSVTRPLILSNLKRLFRDHPDLEPHADTLKEMLAFVRSTEGRWEAAQGKHDDLVMALAIAHYVAEGYEPTAPAPTPSVDWLGEHFDLSPKPGAEWWD